jgi:hypothetical protein
MASGESERDKTCVAPSDLRKSVCFSEAVAMIGEKPDSRANWMAVAYFQRLQATTQTVFSPYWPTEVEPPKTTNGWPAYEFGFSQKVTSSAPPPIVSFFLLYIPRKAVATPSGTEAASSVLMLSGILAARSTVTNEYCWNVVLSFVYIPCHTLSEGHSDSSSQAVAGRGRTFCLLSLDS